MVKLEAARSNSGMDNERRVVTMLFCDAKGSTTASEHVRDQGGDPRTFCGKLFGHEENLISMTN